MDTSEANLRAHHVWVSTDSAFQRRCRLQQALWREAMGIPIGRKPNGDPLGSRIAMPRAKELLENYLTPTIRDVVRAEVMDGERGAGKLYGEPRIYDNLLSSQPLCFNLFGELQRDLDLASRFFRRRCPDRIDRVSGIQFEHSPGRRDPRYTGDRSAFDVFVEYVSRSGRRGFLGIEVKYHEALTDAPASHRDRYDELARACGWWHHDRLEGLRLKPLQQIWRDHLLAASLVVSGDFDEGAFIFLAPRENAPCTSAVAAFQKHVLADGVFSAWNLEDVISDLAASESEWAASLAGRYT